jgi:phosphate transport system substrate-binding protein
VRRTTRLYLPGATVALAVALLIGCSDSKNTGGGAGPNKAGLSGGGKTKVTGSGSTFVQPLMDAWVKEYKKATGGEVSYQGVGSTAGIKNMLKRSEDFGATDAFMSDKDIKQAEENPKEGAVLHIPLVMGGIVPAYNVEGVTKPIHFTGESLAKIYLGQIKKWSELKTIAGNESLNLPDQNIAVVSRADGSGSTNIFTHYLCEVSADFKKIVNEGTKVTFPVGGKEDKTPGVANFIKNTPNSLGYIELTYALQNEIQYGALENKAKKFVRADIKSVEAAAAAALKDNLPDDLRFHITNAPGDDSYPLAGTTWAVIYVKQPAATAKALTDFFTWVAHDGQKMAPGLHYAALPAVVVERIDAKLKTIQAQ